MRAIPSRILAVLFVVLLSFSTLAILNVRGETENIWGNVPPRDTTLPPEINIQTPQNNTYHNTSTITLSLNVTVGKSLTATQIQLKTITIKPDWQTNSTILFEDEADLTPPSGFTKFSSSINLTDVPDGNHTIAIYANERGTYYGRVYPFSDKYYTFFEIDNSAIVNFIINTEQLTPTPSIEPTQTPPPPIRFSSPNLIIATTISLLVGLGIIAYFKKYRK